LTSPPRSPFTANQPRLSSRRARTAGYYTVITLIGFIAAILGPSLPGLAESTRTAVGLLGSLFTVRSLGGLLGSSLSGGLYDRLPGHSVLAVTLIGLSVSLAVVPLISTLWLLGVFIFLWGLGESFLDVGVNTQLIWTYQDRAAPYLNGLHFFFGVGALLAPLLYVQVVQATGQYNWAFWILAAAMLPVALWMISMHGPTPQREAAYSSSARFSLPVFIICTIFFLYVGAEVSYGGWVYTYALNLQLADITSAGLLNSTFWGMLTVGRLLAVPAAVIIRPGRLLAGALVGCLISLAVLWLGPGGPLSLWIGTIGLGFSMAPIFPTLLAVAGRRITLTGRVTSWFFIASNAGGMTLPWAAGLLLQEISPQAIMPLLFFDLFIAVVLLGVLGIVLPSAARKSAAA
jgi:fucose permease